MNIALMGFKLCPFVQRVRITLLHKQVEHQMTYLDPQNLPAWFHDLSPLGKVPLLRVTEENRETILFESAVLNEFIDEISPSPLHPQDPVIRALHRGWIEWGSAALMDLFQLTGVPTEEAWAGLQKNLQDKLDRVEAACQAPYFQGDRFSLVDTAFAPLLMRLVLVSRLRDLLPESRYPKLRQWHHALSQREAVSQSVIEGFDNMYLGYVKNRSPFLAAQSS